MPIVAGDDETVAGWVAQKLGVDAIKPPYRAFGFIDQHGTLIGGCVFNDYYPDGNVEMTYYGPKAVTRSNLGFIASFCFDQLKAARITAKTRRMNVLARRILPKGGFIFEGTQKRYFGPSKGDDALVFVMFKDNAARWLAASKKSMKEVHHG